VDDEGLRRFGFRFDGRYRAACRVFGVTEDRAWVEVDPAGDGRYTASFGRWRLETPLANVECVEISGPYSVVKTIGPARLSLADKGLTFATNRDRGVCLGFVEPVAASGMPGRRLRHPGLTVTVADVDGLHDLVAGWLHDRGRAAPGG
jgi:hypothetical protein